LRLRRVGFVPVSASVRLREIMQILGYILLILVVLVCVLAWSRHRFWRACRGVFERVYVNSSSLPAFEMSSSYGFPAFKVTFRSKSEMQAAASEGLNAEFLRLMNDLCKDQGSKDRPFSAEIATYFTHESA
jgi:hypothetical protein